MDSVTRMACFCQTKTDRAAHMSRAVLTGSVTIKQKHQPKGTAGLFLYFHPICVWMRSGAQKQHTNLLKQQITTFDLVCSTLMQHSSQVGKQQVGDAVIRGHVEIITTVRTSEDRMISFDTIDPLG